MASCARKNLIDAKSRKRFSMCRLANFEFINHKGHEVTRRLHLVISSCSFVSLVVDDLANHQHFADGIARQEKLDRREIPEEVFNVPVGELRIHQPQRTRSHTKVASS